MVKKLINDKKLLLLIATCSIILFLYYVRYVFQINTAYELPDEYGYLVNAAYLSGNKWSYLTNMYYGYGYSILLMPLFWFGTNGTQIIRGAILINAVCILLTFGIQIVLMSKMFKQVSRYQIILVAFVLSFYPYLLASATKVLCEVFLNLLVWLAGLLIFQLIETEKWQYGLLLAINLAWISFTHTRAVIFVISVILVSLLYFCINKEKLKKFWKWYLVLAVFLGLGYCLKQNLTDTIYKSVALANHSEESATVVNTISGKHITGILTRIFRGNWLSLVYLFADKCFYLFVSTFGTFYIGLYAVIKTWVNKIKKKETLIARDWLSIIYAFSSLAMIAVLTLSSRLRTENVAFNFYGRYYEYLVLPVCFIGIVYVLNNKLNWKIWTGLISCLVVVSGLSYAQYSMLESQKISVDTFRWASFSYIISEWETYRSVIAIQFGIVLVFLIALWGIQHWKQQFGMVFLAIMLSAFLLNNQVIGSTVVEASQNALLDNEIFDYIMETTDSENVYFWDGQYISLTTKAQILLGKKTLCVIENSELENLEPGTLVITYYHAEELPECLQRATLIKNGYNYQLFAIAAP